jgi:Fic family protein
MQGVRGEDASSGEFRRRQNFIGTPESRIEQARFVPPPPAHLEESLEAFEKYLAVEDYPPLVRLALIHYQFEAIHPFIDGNGRIGRLLITLLLCNWGLLPLPLLYLSAFFERNRRDYYDLLREVSERGAWLEWIVFFLAGVIEQARDAARRAQELQDLQAVWRGRLAQARASALVPALADMLFEAPLISIPIAEKRLGVTYNSARNAVAHLVGLGILRQIGDRSYNKVYIADAIIRIIS